MQITVTDHNDWEGEDFSFVLEVDEETANKIKAAEDEEGTLEVELHTSHTQKDIDKINRRSRNGYMDRIGFYSLQTPSGEFDWYEDVFYKGVGLKRIK